MTAPQQHASEKFSSQQGHRDSGVLGYTYRVESLGESFSGRAFISFPLYSHPKLYTEPRGTTK
jgi:hypothetical protein